MRALKVRKCMACSEQVIDPEMVRRSRFFGQSDKLKPTG